MEPQSDSIQFDPTVAGRATFRAEKLGQNGFGDLERERGLRQGLRRRGLADRRAGFRVDDLAAAPF